jgi:prolyl 4-hydroxylase
MKVFFSPALVFLIAACARGKDDGFDEPMDARDETAEEELARHKRIADEVQKEAFLYGEKWADADLNVVRMNHRINSSQPPRVPKFTKAGFKKAKIPAQLWGQITDWYKSAKPEGSIHPESNIVGYLNNNNVPNEMVEISEFIRQQTFTVMGEVLREWIDPKVYAGSRELQGSACYGVRKYVRGNTLQRHVDRLDTHAISAILNIGQENVEVPWTLEIVDHQGINHSVTMEPGEMILYESARLVHGRPHPLKGDAYYNLFVHYRPKHGWDYR